jgi:hypothetical protein
MIGASRASATETALATSPFSPSPLSTLPWAMKPDTAGSVTAKRRPEDRPGSGQGADTGAGTACRPRQPAAAKTIEAALAAIRYVIKIVCTMRDPMVIALYIGQVLIHGKQERV